jgi:hypothetical protein
MTVLADGTQPMREEDLNPYPLPGGADLSCARVRVSFQRMRARGRPHHPPWPSLAFPAVGGM